MSIINLLTKNILLFLSFVYIMQFTITLTNDHTLNTIFIFGNNNRIYIKLIDLVGSESAEHVGYDYSRKRHCRVKNNGRPRILPHLKFLTSCLV